MSQMNFATANLQGHVTRKPETTVFSDGNTSTRLGVAVNRSWEKRDAAGNRTGNWDEAVSYFNVIIKGPIGEKLANELNSGDYITVTNAEIRQRTWESDSGDKRSAIEFHVTARSGVARAFNVTKAELAAKSQAPAAAPTLSPEQLAALSPEQLAAIFGRPATSAPVEQPSAEDLGEEPF